MKKVKRWEWTHDGMWDNDANDGEYVLCSDYEKLQKENAALNEIKRTLIRRVELLEVQNSKITKLTRKLEIYKKALDDISASIKWYDEVFMGPEHEFAHWWRVELRGNFIDPAIQEAEGVG